INMGCPVQKVTKSGCGSAILKDPVRVFETVRRAAAVSPVPLSVKIRIGWDRASINAVEVAQAIAQGGAAWITIHGRTRHDDYSTPVDLDTINSVKQQVSIPVIGNGNLFSRGDRDFMVAKTAVDGLMVSRGALGNPWVFGELAGKNQPVALEDW